MEPQEWPKWLYLVTGEGRIFASPEEVPADEDWHDYTEVYDDQGQLTQADADAVSEKAALVAQLTDKGITFDGRWGLAKLQAALAEAPPA